MVKIILKQLTITNFKGIKSLTIDFNEQETNILGANGTGKSSIMDAFMFLFFGKDAQDRKNFDIKNTVDLELNRQDHEVCAEILVDDRSEKVKRVFREKWVKKQGSDLREMIGHETLFFWNEVPMQAGEFTAKVETILPEKIFKLLSNALYFNSLKWEERRNILFDIAGEITDEQIASGSDKFVALLAQLENKSVEDYKKQISGEKKLLKTSLDEIGPRIDERLKSMPKPLDFAAIEKSISGLNLTITKIDQDITNRTQSHQAEFDNIQAKQKDLHALKSDQNTRRFSIKNKIQEDDNKVRSEITFLESKISTLKDNITSKQTLIKGKYDIKVTIESQMDKLREDWKIQKEREFKYDESKFSCPTCNRDFETDDIEESKKVMKDNFDVETARLYEDVNERGLKLKKEIEDNDALIITAQTALTGLEKELVNAEKEFNDKNIPAIDLDATLESLLSEDKAYDKLLAKIIALETELNKTEKPQINTQDLVDSKAPILLEIDELKKQLNIRDQIKITNDRISELKAQEKELSQKLAKLEGTEFTIDEFNKAKIDIVESRINSKFKYTTFKMFDQFINGGTEPNCVSKLKGVPFDVLNTAGRIWCGLDIIATLSQHYGFSAPIFLDNRESTVLIPEIDSQVINLIVSAANETLKIA